MGSFSFCPMYTNFNGNESIVLEIIVDTPQDADFESLQNSQDKIISNDRTRLDVAIF